MFNTIHTKILFSGVIWMSMLISSPLISQEYSFINGFHSPVFLNPGFAGTDETGNLSLHTKISSYIPGQLVDFAAGWDQPVKKLRGGLAVIYSSAVWKDFESRNLLEAGYALHLKPGPLLKIIPSVRLGIGIYHLKPMTLGPVFDGATKAYITTGAGVLVLFRGFSGGAVINHLNTPEVGYENLTEELPVAITLHARQKFRTDREGVFLYTGAYYWQQEDWSRIVPSVEIKVKGFFAGLCAARYHDIDVSYGLGGTAGFDLRKFKAGYSFIGDLSGRIRLEIPAHEIFLIYRFDLERK